MSSSEPGSRKEFFSFKKHPSVYLWGGKTGARGLPVVDLHYLYEFNYTTGVWARLHLNGQHPPGIHGGSCVRIDDSVYFYGGLDKSGRRTASVYQLNLTTLTWQELSPSGACPSKKQRFGMIKHKKTLLIHGGDTEFGRTNETHIFDIATETWSSPQITGDVPKPDGDFEFCKVSQNTVVKCGGMYDSSICVLDLSTMHWTKVYQFGPDFGLSPTATCLGFTSDHAQILIIGLNGVWLLDVATWELKKLQDTDLIRDYEYLRRYGHSTTVLSSTPTLIELLILGGLTDYLKISPILLIFKKIEDKKWWRMAEIHIEEKWKERNIFYHSDPNCEVKDSAIEVRHVDEENMDTDKNIRDESEFNNGRLNQEEVDTVSKSSHASQISSSQSSQTSSQASSSRTNPNENIDVEEHFDEDQLTPEKMHFTSDVTAAILKKQNIKRKVANLLLKGLPGSGKTSLLDRLLNLPLRTYCPSTGLCERIVTVEVGPSSTHISVYTGEDSAWKVTNFDKSILSQLDACKVFISYDTSRYPPRHLQHHEGKAHRFDHPVSDIEQHVKKVLQKHNINNIVDLQTKNSLYIRDTGGQVEFQESLSLLIFGPSIFIFVLRTDIDIHAKNIIQYRQPNGEIINYYESCISTMNALIQFLTSVSAIQTTEKEVFQEDGTSLCHKPIVFIVGTHIDRLGSDADSILSNINKILHEMIFRRNYSDLIRYADFHLNKVMYEVDNTCSDDKQCQQLRSDINKFIQDRDEFFVMYPVSYLLFCLELQNINETVLSMDDCKKLAAKFYIEENEIPSLLKFLHFRVGIIQHYNVEGISDVVIKEPQVLFNKVTDLILQTFLSSGSVSGGEHERFMKKGILEVSAFREILSKTDKITSDQFLLFLLHLRVAVPFTDKDGVLKYIIPSVLNHVRKSPSEIINSDIAFLAITFKLGHCPQGLLGMLISYLLNPEENPELTFDLLEDQIYQDQVSLRVNSSDDGDKISLRSHLSHLEVSIVLDKYQVSSTSVTSQALRETTINDVCCKVRLTLDKCLQQSLKKLHYNYVKIGPCFSLACPDMRCFLLHEVKKGKKFWFMRCSTSNCKLLLPESGLYWFEEESATSYSCDSSEASANASTRESSKMLSTPKLHAADTSVLEAKKSSDACALSCENTQQKPNSTSGDISQVPDFSLKTLILLKWSDKDGRSHSLRLRNEISSSWRDVGILLGLSSSRLDGIKSYRLGDVRLCCSDVLQDWLRNGSSDYPASWEGLLALLEDVELNSLKLSLQDALKNC